MGWSRAVAWAAAVMLGSAALVGPTPAFAMTPPDLGSGQGRPSSVEAVVHPRSPVPRYPLPTRSGAGRRVVYSQHRMHVWVVGTNGKVIRDWKVSGRRDWPDPGSYRVFSKSPTSSSPISHVTFRWMVRFAQGHSLSIGFHSIPRDGRGRPIQTIEQLGHPVVGGGCVRSRDSDARWLYAWAGVGTSVVVVG